MGNDALFEAATIALEEAWQAAYLARYDGVQSLIKAAQEKLVDALAAEPEPSAMGAGDQDYIDALHGVVALPDHMDRSLADFATALRVLIAEETASLNPNTALIAVLCDAGRLGWENIQMARSEIPIKRVAAFIVCANGAQHYRRKDSIDYDPEELDLEAFDEVNVCGPHRREFLFRKGGADA